MKVRLRFGHWRDRLSEPQWLAEFMLAAPLFLLGVLIQFGVTGAILSRVMPLWVWGAWLMVSGGTHLACLLFGSFRARYISSAVFLPEIYALLLVAFGAFAPPPRRDVAFLSVLFAAAILVVLILRNASRNAR